LLSAPLIPGATATVENNEIHYTPAVGIVASDLLVYRVYDALGASDTAVVSINVTGITGFDEIADVTAKIYPNPFSESFEFQVSSFELNTNSTIQIFDAKGKEIVKQQLQTPNLELQTSNWSSGIYFLKMSSDQGILVKKIVKQ